MLGLLAVPTPRPSLEAGVVEPHIPTIVEEAETVTPEPDPIELAVLPIVMTTPEPAPATTPEPAPEPAPITYAYLEPWELRFLTRSMDLITEDTGYNDIPVAAYAEDFEDVTPKVVPVVTSPVKNTPNVSNFNKNWHRNSPGQANYGLYGNGLYGNGLDDDWDWWDRQQLTKGTPKTIAAIAAAEKAKLLAKGQTPQLKHIPYTPPKMKPYTFYSGTRGEKALTVDTPFHGQQKLTSHILPRYYFTPQVYKEIFYAAKYMAPRSGESAGFFLYERVSNNSPVYIIYDHIMVAQDAASVSVDIDMPSFMKQKEHLLEKYPEKFKNMQELNDHLGHWHVHPGFSVRPSGTDDIQYESADQLGFDSSSRPFFIINCKQDIWGCQIIYDPIFVRVNDIYFGLLSEDADILSDEQKQPFTDEDKTRIKKYCDTLIKNRTPILGTYTHPARSIAEAEATMGRKEDWDYKRSQFGPTKSPINQGEIERIGKMYDDNFPQSQVDSSNGMIGYGLSDEAEEANIEAMLQAEEVNAEALENQEELVAQNWGDREILDEFFGIEEFEVPVYTKMFNILYKVMAPKILNTHEIVGMFVQEYQDIKEDLEFAFSSYHFSKEPGVKFINKLTSCSKDTYYISTHYAEKDCSYEWEQTILEQSKKDEDFEPHFNQVVGLLGLLSILIQQYGITIEVGYLDTVDLHTQSLYELYAKLSDYLDVNGIGEDFGSPTSNLQLQDMYNTSVLTHNKGVEAVPVIEVTEGFKKTVEDVLVQVLCR